MRRFVLPKNIPAARELQEKLRKSVIIRPLGKTPRTIAAVDAAFSGESVVAVASLFSYPSPELIDEAHAVSACPFPYVPGYLSFREGPSIVKAIRKLNKRPDLLLVDGQGIAHPRRLGIASHLGVLLGIPSVGCAKSRLIGDYEEPDGKQGGWSPLLHKGELIGAVLRTRDNVRPVFVSPGHLVTLQDSIEIVMGTLGRYRIPEPLRRADHRTKELTKELVLGNDYNNQPAMIYLVRYGEGGRR